MLFTDRQDAGALLATVLKKDSTITRSKHQAVVVSLLRGGIVVGHAVAKTLKTSHLPLVVAKIPAPGQEELALGAVCFDITYLEKKVVASLEVDKQTSRLQIDVARQKFNSYVEKYAIKEDAYDKLKDKAVILVDDGIATGASVRAAYLYLKSMRPKKLILAVPVGPTDFEMPEFDKVYVYHRDPSFAAVSQYYKDFPQVTDTEVKKVLSS